MAQRTTSRSELGSVEIVGLRECLKAFDEYGKEANREVRKAAQEIVRATATEVKERASGLEPMQRLASESVRAKSDRVPTIVGGGVKRMGKRKNSAGEFWFGAEFGGGGRPTTQMFRPHLGRVGYFFWPTIRKRSDDDLRLYVKALNELARRWSEK
jgi:hypothetical protein